MACCGLISSEVLPAPVAGLLTSDVATDLQRMRLAVEADRELRMGGGGVVSGVGIFAYSLAAPGSTGLCRQLQHVINWSGMPRILNGDSLNSKYIPSSCTKAKLLSCEGSGARGARGVWKGFELWEVFRTAGYMFAGCPSSTRVLPTARLQQARRWSPGARL